MGTAHGCGAGIAECTLDGDCDQGQACEVSECVPVCGSDADCGSAEVCLPGLTTERRVCQVTDDQDTVNVESRYALVRDSTDGAGCETTDPGSDLAFVVLEDLDGDVAGWGRAVKAGLGEEANDFSSYDHLDGDRPDWGADSCPEFRDSTIVSLGCGGYVAIEFVDENGEDVQARSGVQQIRLGEHGAQCDDGDDLDRYEVLLCPGAEQPDDVPEMCAVSVGVGQGERVFAF